MILWSDVSFSLKEKVLTWSVNLPGQGNIYVVCLSTRHLEGLSLKARKFDLGERLDVTALGGGLGAFGRTVVERAKMRGVRVTSLFTLGQTLNLAFSLGLYLGLNLIQLDLSLDVNF